MVAKHYKTKSETVSKWVKRAKTTGGVFDKPRQGRPQIQLKNEAVESLLQDSMRKGMTCIEMRRLLKREFDIDVGVETLRVHLHKHHGRPRRPQKKPLLNEKQMKKRLDFAKEWVDKDWTNVVVSDSKIFWLCPKGVGSKQWVVYGEDPPILPAPKHQTKLHVYGAVSRWGKTPLFPTAGTTGMRFPSKGVTTFVYVSLLEEKLMPAMRDLMRSRPAVQQNQPWIFQQDGAPAHRSATTKAWLGAQAGVKLMQWPPNSPDLSWIENLWGIVASKLRKRSDLTPRNFKDVVNQEWENIPETTCMSLHDSIKRRLQACINSNGGHTKY